MTDNEPFLITGVAVFDGTGARPVPGQAIVVEGRRIKWIGPQADAPSFTAERTYDGGGGTVIPGLINCHVHVCNDGYGDLFAQVQNDSVPISTR